MLLFFFVTKTKLIQTHATCVSRSHTRLVIGAPKSSKLPSQSTQFFYFVFPLYRFILFCLESNVKRKTSSWRFQGVGRLVANSITLLNCDACYIAFYILYVYILFVCIIYNMYMHSQIVIKSWIEKLSICWMLNLELSLFVMLFLSLNVYDSTPKFLSNREFITTWNINEWSFCFNNVLSFFFIFNGIGSARTAWTGLKDYNITLHETENNISVLISFNIT